MTNVLKFPTNDYAVTKESKEKYNWKMFVVHCNQEDINLENIDNYKLYWVTWCRAIEVKINE